MIYFFDEVAVAAAHNLEPVPGPVEKLGTVLKPDRPSDGKRCMSFASSIVPLENGRWRMYYSISDFAANLKSIAMAESTDGLHWEKPMLGQVQVDGVDTNRLDIKGLAEGVKVERCTQPQVCQVEGGGWRMFFWVNHRPFLRYLVAESGDGLHWEVTDFEQPIIYHPLELGAWIWTPGVLPPVETRDLSIDQETLGRFVPGEEAQWGHLLEKLDADELMRLKGLRANDAVYVYRDMEHGLYELYAPWPMCNIEGSPRRWEDDNAPFMLRAIHRRTSTDGQNWSDADLIIAPDAGDRPDQQFYYLAVHRQNGWRIGMLGSYPVAAKTMDIELCFSRDGQRWDRPLRVPWIRREDGEEEGMVYAPNRLIEMGDDWLLLYTASPCRHDEVSAPEQERATVRAARFPKNRFMGLATAADGIGRLWTKPFVLGGTELCVDARLDGCLRAELCDPFGKTLPGFESNRCRLVSGDRVDHVLRWEGSAVAPYQYNAVSLRLEVEQGAIYNIHWRRDADGV